jgi:hypothetical protein
MSDEKAKDYMPKRLLKLKNLLNGIALPADEDREARYSDFVALIYVGDDINKQLHAHPGIYAYMAEQRAQLQDAVDRTSYNLAKAEQAVGDTLELVVSIIRIGRKMTDEQKKEIKSILRLGDFPNTHIYHELEFPESDIDTFQTLNEKYADLVNLMATVDKLTLELFDYRARLNLVSELVSALGFQKLPCLKALVERETTGLAQQI